MTNFQQDVKIRQLQERTPMTGSGSPEGVVTASVGSLYTDGDPAPGDPVLYVKETDPGMNTGWVGK